MRLHSLSLIFLAALAGGLAAPCAAPAAAPDYAHAPTMNRLLHWVRLPVRVFVATHNGAEEGQARTALAGFDEWVGATGGRLRYQIVNAPGEADIVVRFVADEWVPGHPNVVGLTDIAWRGTVLKGAAMRLATGGATPDELQSVAAHEFGHALGLEGHSDDPDDLLYPAQVRILNEDSTPVPGPPHPVTARDLNTLRLCYPGLF